MAVYEHSYRRYTGELTGSLRRFLVIPRYNLEMILKSRGLLVFMIVLLLPVLGAATAIYFSNNETLMKLFEALGEVAEMLTVGPGFFLSFGIYQMVGSFVLAIFLAPSVTSSDLRNNALPLYLSRPLTRMEYVAAKLLVIVLMLSVVTWLPLLSLWELQAVMHVGGWAGEHMWLLPTIVASVGLWILQLALIGLALSVWVKWKAIARLSMFGIFLGSSIVAKLINWLFVSPGGREWGNLIDLFAINERVWQALYRQPVEAKAIPLVGALFMIALVCAFSVFLISRKVRAYEVV